MRNTFYIAWRETRAYFLTPTAYIVGAMFLVLTGIFFVFQVTSTRPEASVRSIIEWATFFMVFFGFFLTPHDPPGAILVGLSGTNIPSWMYPAQIQPRSSHFEPRLWPE